MGGPSPVSSRSLSGNNVTGGRATGKPRRTMTYGWLWPGLPQLWLGGEWRGFGLAVIAAVALQGWILVAWVWEELSQPIWFGWGIGTLAVLWVYGVVSGRRWLKRFAADSIDELPGDLFPSAFAEYLQGNWFAAEQNCRELIRVRRHDVDARLLLTSVLRRMDRRLEALNELNALTKLDGADKWQWEIEEERSRLEATEVEGTNDDEAERPETTATPVAADPPLIRRAA